MYHVHYQKQERKIPGIAVLAVLLVFVGVLVQFFRNDSPPVVMQDARLLERVDVVNVRDTALTVYWRTSAETVGYVEYGASPDKLDQKATDERDLASQLTARHNHVALLPRLQAQSKIYFRIVVDGQKIGQSVGIPFEAETARPISTTLDVPPIYGEVFRSNGAAEEGAIVIATIGAARPILTQTNSDGTFLLSPCCLYHAQTREALYPGSDESVRMEIISEDGTSQLSQASLGAISPLQDRILVDAEAPQSIKAFANDDAPSPTPASEGSADPQLAQADSQPEVLAASDTVFKLQPVDILFPRDQASIPGSRPLVRGVGAPQASIRGRFTPQDRLFQVTVDEDRNWVYQPSFDFEPGQHTLTVDTLDDNGRAVQLSRIFTILKSGEAVLGDATPSGTLTPTESPTPEPTQAPLPTSIATPTPPVSGFNVLPFTLLSLVLIVIGAGIVLLF